MQNLKNNKIKINASTELYCIFGNPVRHSLSPALHNSAFRELNINAVYLAFETADIKSGIDAMKALNIIGASVTIPFKNEAFKYVDETDSIAIDIGAINTLHNKNGKIYGYNTDGSGAVQALLNNDVRIKGSRILIIGNGGSARAIAFALIKEGADVVIAGRNPDRIQLLVNDIRKTAGSIDHILISSVTEDYLQSIDIIINTTPVGMLPDTDKLPMRESLIQRRHIVFDIVYYPDTTKLLKISKDKGCKIIRGIEMLVNQGAKQFEIWTSIKAPLKAMEKEVRKQLTVIY